MLSVSSLPGLLEQIQQTALTEEIAAVLIVVLFIIDVLRDFHSSQKEIQHPYLRAMSDYLTVFIFIIIFYPIIYYLFGVSVANRFIYSLAGIYTFFHSLPGGRSPFIHVTATLALLFLIIPIDVREIYYFLLPVYEVFMDNLEDRPISIFAAVFAYLGWQASTSTSRFELEEALAARLEGKELGEDRKDSLSSTVTKVRVGEESSIYYKIRKYLPFSQFRGETALTLCFQDPVEFDIYETYDTHIRRYRRFNSIVVVNRKKIILTSTSVNVNQIESELEDAFHSFQFSAERYEPLEVGKRVKPRIQYSPPKGLLRGLISFIELRHLRNLIYGDDINYQILGPTNLSVFKSIWYRIPSSLSGKSSSTLTRITDMRIWYDDQSHDYYRGILHLLLLYLPLLKNYYSKEAPIYLSARRHTAVPLIEGLQRLRRSYSEIKILQIRDREYEDNIAHKSLHLQRGNIYLDRDHLLVEIPKWLFSKLSNTGEDQESDHVPLEERQINIPIESFRPSQYESIELEESYRLKDISDLENRELNADYVLNKSGKIVTIYDMDSNPGICATQTYDGHITISELEFPGQIDKEGLIWKRETHTRNTN